MAYSVRRADIYKDKELLLTLLTENRQRELYPLKLRYDWLYYQNPYGEATAWVIWDDKKELPAGFTAVYPRRMLVQGQEKLCWNCGDFSIRKKYRTLGIAVKLRKEARRHVDEGNIPFLYAHPNNQMVHIHLRAGHREITKVKRFALPIRLTKYLGSSFPGKVLAASVNPVVERLLKFRFQRVGEFQHRDQSRMTFDEGFAQLCREVNAQVPVVGLRDETYLTWKYKQHPMPSFYLFRYYEKGKLVGYVVYHLTNGVVHVTELFSRLDRSIQKNMLLTFIHGMIDTHKDAQSITTVIAETNPFVPILTSCGFKYRDDSTTSAIAYTADPSLQEIIHDGRNWFLTSGDRDA